MKQILFLIFLSPVASAIGQNALAPDKVHVTADLVSDHHDPAKSADEVVVKTMKLTLENHSNQDINNATVRVVFYASELTKDTVIVEKTLVKPISLAGRKNAVIAMDAVTFKFTPSHGESVKGRRGKSSSKRVAATGHRYAGYSIEIIESGKVVGWGFSAKQFDPTVK